MFRPSPRKLLSPGVRALLASARRGLRAAWYAGKSVDCPCCGGRFRRFLPYGRPVRPQALCPRCGSFERHRLIWLYLRQEPNLLAGGIRLLHIAPEAVLRARLSCCGELTYVTGDLAAPATDVRLDVCNLPFPDGSFDVVLCNHVLEHIPDDAAAVREVCRVLDRGGRAVLQTPVDLSLEVTLEDTGGLTPEERADAFGQADHVRQYGRDYPERLEREGFRVDEVVLDAQRDPGRAARMGLMADERIYIAVKA